METGTQIIDSSSKKNLGTFLRFLVGVALLAALMYFLDPAALWSAITTAALGPILVAFGLIVLNIGPQILKWTYLLRLIDRDIRWKEAIASFFFGMTAGMLTPGHVGELAGRPLHVASQSAGLVLGMTVIDKMQMLGFIAVGGLISLRQLVFPENLPLSALCTLLSAAILFLLIRPGLVKAILISFRLEKIKHPFIREGLGTLDLLKPRDVAVTLLLTLVFYTATWLQLHALINAFTDSSPIESFLGFAAMMFVKSLLPISFGDLGTRELSSVYFFSLLGVSGTAVFNASLLLFLFNIFVPAVVGLFFLPPASRFSFRTDKNSETV